MAIAKITAEAASLLDITPTLLTMFGLPVGENMDGTPLVQLFEKELKVDSITSWETVEGEAGMLPRDVQDDPLAAQEALKQLVELGYIEEPGEDMELAVTRTVKEMRYNLARVYLGANQYDKATPLLEELYANEPDQPRFALRLAQCYLALNESEKCDSLLQDFMKHESEYIKTHSFEKIKEEKMPEELEADDKQKEREKWQREYRQKISRLQMAGETAGETPDHAESKKKVVTGTAETPTEEDTKQADQPAVVQRAKPITGEPVIVVSGLPRSGTSMMMQMLEAGGLPIYTDKQRQPDESNPKGYYEHENVKRLMRDASWIKETPGKVVKIIAQLLPYVPARYVYKVIFMDRALEEVVRSQHAMLVRSGSKRVKADVYPYHLETQFQKHLDRIRKWEKQRANIDVLWVAHKETLENPIETAQKVPQFLGSELDVLKMAASVDTALYRTKA